MIYWLARYSTLDQLQYLKKVYNTPEQQLRMVNAHSAKATIFQALFEGKYVTTLNISAQIKTHGPYS